MTNIKEEFTRTVSEDEIGLDLSDKEEYIIAAQKNINVLRKEYSELNEDFESADLSFIQNLLKEIGMLYSLADIDEVETLIRAIAQIEHYKLIENSNDNRKYVMKRLIIHKVSDVLQYDPAREL